MKVYRATVLGMCMGVRRAQSMAEEAASRGKAEGRKVFTYGPLIHNPQAVADLAAKGAAVLDTAEFDAGALDAQVRGSIVVIRAHGAPDEAYRRLSSLGAEVVDATCPRVTSSQRKARDLSERGYSVAIAGDRSHGEVAGILGHAPGARVVQDETEARQLTEAWGGRKVALIAQTTISHAEYDAIRSAFAAKCPELLVIDTLCPATSERQEALASLFAQTDAIIVVGGRNSANTRRLAMTAKAAGKTVWHIEKASELTEEILSRDTVGLTAGASTPDSMVDEVEAWLLEGGHHEHSA